MLWATMYVGLWRLDERVIISGLCFFLHLFWFCLVLLELPPLDA